MCLSVARRLFGETHRQELAQLLQISVDHPTASSHTPSVSSGSKPDPQQHRLPPRLPDRPHKPSEHTEDSNAPTPGGAPAPTSPTSPGQVINPLSNYSRPSSSTPVNLNEKAPALNGDEQDEGEPDGTSEALPAYTIASADQEREGGPLVI